MDRSEFPICLSSYLDFASTETDCGLSISMWVLPCSPYPTSTLNFPECLRLRITHSRFVWRQLFPGDFGIPRNDALQTTDTDSQKVWVSPSANPSVSPLPVGTWFPTGSFDQDPSYLLRNLNLCSYQVWRWPTFKLIKINGKFLDFQHGVFW